MKYLVLVCFWVIPLAFSSNASATISEITDAITQICDRPSDAGKYWDVSVGGEGDAKIKLLLSGSVTGEAKFSKGEWEGTKKTIEGSKDYRECAVKLTPIFIDKFSGIGIEEREKNNPSREIGGVSWIDAQGGVTIELKMCKKLGSRTNCTFVIEGLTDKDLALDCRSKYCPAYDQEGNVFYPSSISISNMNDRNKYLSFSLVQGVPVKMTISYDMYKTSESIPKITLKMGKNKFIYRNMDINIGN